MTVTDAGSQFKLATTNDLRERIARLEHENSLLIQERDSFYRGGEEALRTLMEGARALVFRLSPKGLIEYVSPGVREIYGYDTEEFKGLFFEKTTPVSELPKAIKALTRALSGEAIVNLDLAQVDSAGNTIIIEMNGAPVIVERRVVAFQGVMRDVTLRKRAEEAARNSTAKLIKAMDETMQAVAMIVEMRDPYTAGHQRRVAQLACAIAEDMGLPADQITGLRLAGLIHDIGKVRVPAEILTNPGALSDAEMSIVKMHPTLGYDVLKTLKLPWPVAQTVHQHHERIDGSGYPFGLAGTDIIVEARVLAVADVVEAIASRRPYRPARAVDEALDEISERRNILYDGTVAASCLRVFKERGFQFQ